MTRTLQWNRRQILSFALIVLIGGFFISSARAADAGRIKVVKGAVSVERGGKHIAAAVGMPVQVSDSVVTGPNGSVGITFLDDSVLTAGPNSRLAIDKFAFDPTTHRGEFETSLKRGTLAAISGKLVKQQPESMRVRTPAAIMGVRGTEFVVRVAEAAN